MAEGSFTPEQINAFVGLGFLVENLVPYNDLTMIQVISKLLSWNESAINATLGPELVPGMSTLSTLMGIDAALKVAPHDSSAIGYLRDFTIMTAVTVPFVGIRFYTRKYVTPRELRFEDWSCLVAYIFCILLYISWIILCVYGFASQHIYDITLHNLRTFIKIIFGSEIIFYIAHFFVKSAFLVFYWKLYPNGTFRRCIIANGVYIFALTISGIGTVTFQCIPVDWWNHLITAKCVNLKLLGIIHASLYIFADLFLLLLLSSAVWKLQLATKQKLELIGVFGIGAFITIISVIRTLKLNDWLASADMTYAAMWLGPWIVLEVNLCVIVSCAPAIKAFLYRRRYAVDRTGTPRRLNFPGASKLSWVTGGFYRPRQSKDANGAKARGGGASLGLSEASTMMTMGSVLDREKDSHVQSVEPLDGVRRSGQMQRAAPAVINVSTVREESSEEIRS